MTYDELVSIYPLRRIKSEEELDKAEQFVESLFNKSLSLDEEDYLHVLCLIVEEYESKHHPIPSVSGVDVLKHLIDVNGLKQKDLLPIFKSSGITSEVLSGKRKLTVNHIRLLAKRFNISTDAFFDEV